MQRAHVLAALALAAAGCRSVAAEGSDVAAEASSAQPGGPRAEDEENPARRLALDVLERLGGREAWEAARHLSWRFFGGRFHAWDKHTGDVRIEEEDVVYLLNVATREGRVFRAGREVTDATERTELLERGHALWVNDSYWLVMPYKLLDPGVRLVHLGAGELADGRPADVLELTFEPGTGLTPDNRYLVRVARDTGLVEEWTFYADAADAEPALTSPWSGWRPFDTPRGPVWLPTDHGRGADWRVEVHAELPRAVYAEP